MFCWKVEYWLNKIHQAQKFRFSFESRNIKIAHVMATIWIFDYLWCIVQFEKKKFAKKMHKKCFFKTSSYMLVKKTLKKLVWITY